jgi:hypothetical protein
MSKRINVNPDHYKVAGRERQGENIVHSVERRTYAQQQAEADRWQARQHRDEPSWTHPETPAAEPGPAKPPTKRRPRKPAATRATTRKARSTTTRRKAKPVRAASRSVKAKRRAPAARRTAAKRPRRR